MESQVKYPNLDVPGTAIYPPYSSPDTKMSGHSDQVNQVTDNILKILMGSGPNTRQQNAVLHSVRNQVVNQWQKEIDVSIKERGEREENEENLRTLISQQQLPPTGMRSNAY